MYVINTSNKSAKKLDEVANELYIAYDKEGWWRIMLKQGNVYILTDMGKKKYPLLEKVFYLNEVNRKYSLVVNIPNSPQVKLGHLTFRLNNNILYFDCRALHIIKNHNIKDESLVSIDDDRVIEGIYELHKKVKKKIEILKESNKEIEYLIGLRKFRKKDCTQLFKKRDAQVEIYKVLSVEPYSKYKEEMYVHKNKKMSIDKEYYASSRFKEVPSTYVKFYRG